ncbi:MAG: Mth938-like domain-containing protein [Aliidongia sp.]
MEIRPVITPGRPYIERYGPGGFKISGTVFTGAVLILPDAAQSWSATGMADVTAESLKAAAEHGGIEILLLGCGRRMQMVPRALREALRAVGIVIDAMDTGAACRTYNVLAAEERRVAAALLPMDA